MTGLIRVSSPRMWGGGPLVIELFRRVGAAQVVNDQVRINQRQRGLMPTQLVEALIALWAAGGDRCQDLQTHPYGCRARHLAGL